MTGLESLGFEALLLLGGAGALALVLAAIRSAIELVPISRARRTTARRAMPLVSTVAALLYCMTAVRTLFAGQPTVAAIASVLVLSGFVAASWSALRDVLSGVFLKAGRVCQQGDHVRIDELNGRIARMGLRVMVLETSEGEEAIIPYGSVARDRLLRTPVVDGVSPHVFRVPLETGASLAELKSRIRRRALLVHWSAVARDPEVTLDADVVEITVYAVDPDRGPDIEAEVRRELASITRPDTPSQPGAEARATTPPSRERATSGR